MAGIDSLVSNRADMFAGNPQGLQQRYAMSQDLLDLLALQKLKKDKEAAQRDLQMQMQAPAATVKDQLAGQVMDMTKQELASSLAPGIQQQGQAMQAQQLQQAMGGGVASQPAPNMVGMARGGIVGYQEGGDVESSEEEDEFTDPYARVLRSLLGALPGPVDMVRGGLRALGPITDAYREGSALAGRGLTQAALTRMPETAPGYQEAVAELEATRPTPPAVDGEEAAYQNSLSSVPPGGIASALPQREVAQRPAPQRAYTDEETEDSVAAMLGEDVAPMQDGQPEAPKDPRISRSEQRLEELKTEQKDKLGSLIEFLLAAGASGGTNLGATLTGGGSGLMARDARIEDEIAKTIQNIETLELEQERMDFERTKLTSEEERARQSRETQLEVARIQNSATRSTDEQRRIDAYKNYFMQDNPDLDPTSAEFMAYGKVAQENVERAVAAAGLQIPFREQSAVLDVDEAARKKAIELAGFSWLSMSPEERSRLIAAEAEKLSRRPATPSETTQPAGPRPPLTEFMQ